MSNLNKVLLIGRVGKDPEVRYTKSGQAVADLNMATNDNWKDKQGNKQERTEWHRVVLWGQLAEFTQNYIKKGRLVFVEGRLQTRDWTDNQNVKRYTTEIVASTIRTLDRDDRPDAGGGQDYGNAQPRQAQGGGGGQGGGGPQGGGGQGGGGQGGGGQGGGGQGRGGPPGGGGQDYGNQNYGPTGASNEPEEAYVEDDIPF